MPLWSMIREEREASRGGPAGPTQGLFSLGTRQQIQALVQKTRLCAFFFFFKLGNGIIKNLPFDAVSLLSLVVGIFRLPFCVYVAIFVKDVAHRAARPAVVFQDRAPPLGARYC